MPSSRCPECEAVVGLLDPALLEEVSCPECGVQLQVVKFDPEISLSCISPEKEDARAEGGGRYHEGGHQ